MTPYASGSDCISLRARRAAYEDAIERWFDTPISSFNNDDYYEDDYYDDEDDYYEDDDYENELNTELVFNANEYEDTDEIEYDAEESYDEDEPVRNRFVVESIMHDVIGALDEGGFSINNFNLFKEDLVYFIYRLSNIQHVT